MIAVTALIHEVKKTNKTYGRESARLAGGSEKDHVNKPAAANTEREHGHSK